MNLSREGPHTPAPDSPEAREELTRSVFWARILGCAGFFVVLIVFVGVGFVILFALSRVFHRR